MELRPIFDEHTINQLVLMFRANQINLEPGFQRKSVWTERDRSCLIESILRGFPLPSIFLYKRNNHRGQTVYDVIDGKQRLETIFTFMQLGRFKREKLYAKTDLGEGPGWYDWPAISRYFPEIRSNFESYKLQAVEVIGELSQIIDLFVRINSTGKRLTSGEKRHARFYTSPFLKEAERLVGRYRNYLREQRILSPAQIDRMKGTELFAELLMSIHNGGPINKKTGLDRAIGNESINGNTLARLVREFTRTIGRIRRMFPHLKQTRFHNSAEYYTLFMFVWEMEKDKIILTDKRRNLIAFEILKKLSTGVDELRDQLRKVKPAKVSQRLYSDYLLTVQGDTDSSANRERRREIVRGLLCSIYERLDEKRTFSSEQRRILWNADDKRLCIQCGKPVTWEDLTIDHVRAYSKGGKTSLKNAQIMHRRCNSRKGAR
jgi:5-methylcytosine-specific restriction endonuclease McrA